MSERSLWASKVYSSSLPPAFSASGQAPSSAGIASIGSCRFRVSCRLPSFRINVAFSSARISAPLLMTPMRSAISSASSM